jgi:hypothetical protein
MRHLSFLLFIFLLLTACHQTNNTNESEESVSGAGKAMEWWGLVRTYPDGQFHTENYTAALAQMLQDATGAADRNNPWEPIGPKNIGGRTLCLAVNPVDTNIIWAGSASGGLWKSTTAGRGATAWQWVVTGFPVLGVSAIAIDPVNPDIMYIGTGEVYNLQNSMPNVAIRTTRGTYGIGILKSIDGGFNWTKSLDWSYGDLRGVQDIKINPLRPQTVYAATSEGLLRSYNAGVTWQTVNNVKMAVDIEINPTDTTKIYVTHGSMNDDAISGIYRSVNSGNSFVKLTNGLPVSYTGKTLLGMSPSNPATIYATVGNIDAQVGLYKTTNGGDSWTLANNQNVCTYQGWYSHDVAVNPTDPEQIIWTGIEAWKSIDGGVTTSHQSVWSNWYFGQVPAGGPEGPPDYVHADIHRAYWLTQDPAKVYLVSDGGIFVSYTGGQSWSGRNGGYQTTQFYANLGNSTTNPNLCIGGMQDNATAIYTGSPAWTRVIGADGCSAAINPQNDQIMYGSTQYLNLRRSTDGGVSFPGISGSTMSSETSCFNAPFEIAPSNPQLMYAGAQSLFKTTNGGNSWTNASNGAVAGGDMILTIAIHPQQANQVFFSSVPPVSGVAHVYRYMVGSNPATQMTGLPDRVCMDIAYHPVNPDTVYAVFSGFNTQHVWRSPDNGNTWSAIDNGLPDVPANCVLVDPLNPTHLFVGNDLGVWLSTNSGSSWSLLTNCAPYAMQVMHLSITKTVRKLRIATHGLGVWQTDLDQLLAAKEPVSGLNLSVSPNPASEVVRVSFETASGGKLAFKLYDAAGRLVLDQGSRFFDPGKQVQVLATGTLASGVYRLVATGGMENSGKPVRASKTVIIR